MNRATLDQVGTNIGRLVERVKAEIEAVEETFSQKTLLHSINRAKKKSSAELMSARTTAS